MKLMSVGAASVGQVLQLGPLVLISDDQEQLPVLAEHERSGVVIASDAARRVGVQGVASELDEVPVPGQLRAIPDEAVDAITQIRQRLCLVGVSAEHSVARFALGALGPIQIDEAVLGEVRVEGDAQQPALVEEVDRQIQDRFAHLSIGHAVHLTGALLCDEEVIGPKEGHRGRLGKAAGGDFDGEGRIRHHRPGRGLG